MISRGERPTRLSDQFDVLTRQQFREYFQPSRIVLGIVPAPTTSGVNIITLCFTMHSSYKPPMMAFAVQTNKYSYELFEKAQECVLAVPGESIAKETLCCGIESGRTTDKVSLCHFTLIKSRKVSVPSLADCIANVELGIAKKIILGDHLTIFGEVKAYTVNRNNKDRCLVSVGPNTKGFEVLARKGIHRIGVVANTKQLTSELEDQI